MPITKTAFFVGTLSLSGIPPLACFWSKDEILNDTWLYSPTFAIIAWATAGLTAFYMFRIYLLMFEGHLNVHFQNYNGKKSSSFYSISLWGQDGLKLINNNFRLVTLLPIKNNESFSKNLHENISKYCAIYDYRADKENMKVPEIMNSVDTAVDFLVGRKSEE